MNSSVRVLLKGMSCLAGLALSTTAMAQSTLYVDASSPGGTGFSWLSPMSDLQVALAYASSHPSVVLIKVAGGTYYPTSGSSRTATFTLVPGVLVYGGFAGLSNPYDPDSDGAGTVLSGAINSSNANDNTFHIVTVPASTATNPAGLQRLNITGGYADDGLGVGGAVYCNGGAVTLLNIVANGNLAKIAGGAMYFNNAQVKAVGISMDTNSTSGLGGAIYLNKTAASFDRPSGTTYGNWAAACTASHGGVFYIDKSCNVSLRGWSFAKNGTWTSAGTGRDIVVNGAQTKSPRLTALSLVSHAGLPSNGPLQAGGIYVNTGGGPKVIIGAKDEDCYFDYGNILYGNGVWVQSGSADISFGHFTNFSQDTLAGGSVGVAGGAFASISHSVFYSQIPKRSKGSAIYVAREGRAVLMNSIVARSQDNYNNPPDSYAPAITNEGNLKINQSTIVYNQTGIDSPGQTAVTNSIIYFNQTPFSGSVTFDYSDVQGGASGTGNISVDPVFESPGFYSDYRPFYTSPVVNVASNGLLFSDANDINGNGNTAEALPWDIGVTLGYGIAARVQLGTVDMGAWESARCPGDFNNDGVVDEADKDAFYWAYEYNYYTADLNLDGVVDELDKGIFFGYYEIPCRGGR